MTKVLKYSRRDLRERAFQALFSLEFGGELSAAGQNAYQYDKENDTDETVPSFLVDLVNGTFEHQSEIDRLISEHLKAGWNLERLALIDKVLLRLGIYEIQFTDTPSRVVVNEIIDIAKKYSDETSAKFINGILTKFVTE